MKKLIFILLIINLINSVIVAKTPLKKADAHVHLVNFLQNGEVWSETEQRFIPPSPEHTPKAGDRGNRIHALLKRMDHANVSVAMISGMPFVKKWDHPTQFRSTYYLDSGSHVVHARDTDYTVALAITDFLSEGGSPAKESRKRLYPFVSGFNATDLGAVDMVVKRIKEFPGLWEGIGEVMSRHDDLTNLTTGERPYANHPSIHRLAHFAGTVHLPISIHHNIAPISPSTNTKAPLYLKEILELFDTHPKTKFIWCHAGISRRINIKNLPQTLRQILKSKKRHRHVHIDLSWVVYENYIYNPKQNIDNRTEWAKLISEFPHTFMIGSDKVADFRGYTKEINKFEPLYDILRPLKNGESLIQKLAHDNFYTLMETLRQKRGGLGAILPPNYVYPESNFVITPKTHYKLHSAKPN